MRRNLKRKQRKQRNQKIQKVQKCLALALAAGAVMAGCGKPNQPHFDIDLPGYKNGVRDNAYYERIEPVVKSKATFVFDRELSRLQKDVVLEDLYRFTNLEIQVPPDSLYAQTFGGVTGDAVLRHFDELTGFFIPDLTEYQFSQRAVAYMDENLIYHAPANTRVRRLAYNLGMALWWSSLTGEISEFYINDRPVKFSYLDPPDGIIAQSLDLMHVDQPARMMTNIVHEPHHSLCTGGVSKVDLEQMKNTPRGEPSAPKNILCGHQHVQCPSHLPNGNRHPYAGEIACDRHYGGAYFVQALVAETLARYCTNCTEKEYWQFSALTFDALSRLLYLDRIIETGSTLLENKQKLPAPDLSSLGVF